MATNNTILQDAVGSNASLTAAINKAPFAPGPLARLKLFKETGIPTTKAHIDYQQNRVVILPTAPRGGVAEPHGRGSRSGFEIEAVHVPTRDAILADEVQNRRKFGTGDLEDIQGLVAEVTAGMRANIEATIENLRWGALRGQVQDYDGSVLHDLLAEFGLLQISKSLDLGNASVQLLNKVIDAERASEDECGGVTPGGYVALCAPDFLDTMRANPVYENSLRYGTPTALMADYRNGIGIANTTFIEVRTPAGLPIRIPAGTAYLVPQDVPDLFLTHYAPGDYVGAVNTPGQPIYAKSEPLPFDKGVMLEAQTNPINVCTRPRAIIRLTATPE